MTQQTTLRFLIFGGYLKAEPQGGMRDLIARKAIRAEALAFAEGYVTGQGSTGWAHVWDSVEGKEVAAFSSREHR